MSVWRDEEAIHLEGDCHVEAAETLVAMIHAHPGQPVDLSQCRHLHSAVVQALLVLKPLRRGDCGDPFVKTWILPVITGDEDGTLGRQG